MLISNCFNTVSVVRQSNTTQSSTSVVSTITISSQPSIQTALSFKFSARCSGVITISGTVSGSSTTEDITISNNTICQSMKKFSNITTIAFDANLVSSGTNVIIKYINMGGSSVPTSSTEVSNFPINLSRSKSELIIDKDGSVQHEIMKGLLPYTNEYSPKEFDILTIDQTSESFIVVGKPIFQQVGINTHWVCNLKRYERT